MNEKGYILHLVSTTADGRLWHTIRHQDGSWQRVFSDIQEKAGKIGAVISASCACVNCDLHLAAVTADGSLWHTVRTPDGAWQQFELNNQQKAGRTGPFMRVATGNVNNELHLLAITGDGNLWHAIRHTNRMQEGAQTQKQLFMDVQKRDGKTGPLRDVACTGINCDLHLATVAADGNLYHTIRFQDGAWQGYQSVQGNAGVKGPFTKTAVANVNNELHLLGTSSFGGLWHTIRHTYTWDPFVVGDVKTQAGDYGEFIETSCAHLNGELHVSGVTADGRLWHTIRHPNGAFDPFDSDIAGQEEQVWMFKDVCIYGVYV